MSTMIRVSEETHTALRDLAREVNAPVGDVVAQAVALLQRERLIDAINAGYANLRDNPAASAEELAERAAWDATLADGLEDW
jgi:predicted transcriptional regulator